MHRGMLPVLSVVGILAVVTVALGPMVSAPIAAAWPAWWPVWSGFALIGVLAVHVARQRPWLARVTAVRAFLAWILWAMPALVYAVVGGRYGLPTAGWGEQALGADEISHWLDRVTAYSLLGAPPIPEPLPQLGATVALVAVYAAPVLALLVLVSIWRSGRRGRRGRA
ncbi:MAG: hypothetical protein LLP51_00180 [Halorhodospira halophila]|uniref:hypothetical protein n=1 Tax=Halorhodospira TaxID=85108 RepID=UPI001913EF5D|nr:MULTISPECIES: hypothetical protein [Halorhodospira]MBK5936969.1 hypothetical protein [Halorhodospira halophila]MBK5944167.1 hypothetical protein [Halorhodospira halophila]MCC3749798.1 hypothetical protein [Halorhodospira halophila]MCG5527714.1 hypothetical protein [Halorhodospira halophila]MCG5532710.1 hypothetical protein [Halorhodospira sp. 9621]